MKLVWIIVTLTLAVIAVVVGCVFWSRSSETQDTSLTSSVTAAETVLPPQVQDRGYVSSNGCRDCHSEQYDSWHDSYHRTMTQPATVETVQAPFDNIDLKYRGQTAHLERRGNEFWVDTVDPEWEIQQFDREKDVSHAQNSPRATNQIVMTTGSHHFQVYWIRSKYGRELWQFPWRYHIKQGRWIHRRHVFLEPPLGRPGMGFRVWNRSCIGCHSVGGVPGMNPSTGNMETTQVAELGIACEACHGPAEKHVQFHQSSQHANSNTNAKSNDSTIVNPANCTPRISSMICGSCHSYFEVFDYDRLAVAGNDYRPGEDITKYGRFMLPTDGNTVISSRFWADGTARSGGREYNGMTASECYRKGKLSCLTCHSMHRSDPDDQLRPNMRGNDACYQCHSSFRERVEEHTHHGPDSTGSMCYNCHMAHTSYALFKGIRNHQINSPEVRSIQRHGRPNACNLCHLDKTLDWSSEHLEKWWDVTRPELTNDEHEIAASLLWLLQGDAGQRVTVAWHMGWTPAQEASGNDWIAPFLATTLNDPYSAVRFVSNRSLRTLPGFATFDFDLEASDRQQKALEGVNIWRKSKSTAHESRSHLLLDSEGMLRKDVIQRLSSNRDDRPLQIVE